MNEMQQYIKALKEGRGYDWISSNGHRLNKYELIDIVKELDYAIHIVNEFDMTSIYNFAANNLDDNYREE